MKLASLAFVRDLQIAARGLRRAPLFAVVTISSLAVGLALTTCMVSVVNAYSMRALPYAAPGRLFHVRYAPPGPWEPRDMTRLDWASVADVVESPIPALSDGIGLTEGGYATATRGLRVNPGFVEGLGIRPILGRTLAADDYVAGSDHAALIGYSLWRDRFGSDPGVIGRIVRGEPDSHPGTRETFHIVGVLPQGFYFGRDSSATVDFVIPEPSHFRAYMVRLRDGVSPAAAERRITQAALAATTSTIPADWPGVQLESVRERYFGPIRPVLTGVAIAVMLVLAIVSANVAVLMLLQSLQRQKESAVRIALGSTCRSMAFTALAEALIVTAIGLIAGLALTAIGLTALSPLIQTQLGRPSPNPAGIAIEPVVIAVVAGIGLLVALVLSLSPLMIREGRLMTALRQDNRVTTDSVWTRRVRESLVAFEVAGSLILLIGCWLMIRSVGQMLSTDLGFDPAGLGHSRVMLKVGKYPDASAYSAFHEKLAVHLSEKIGSPVAFSSWPLYVETPSARIESDNAAGQAGTIAITRGYFSLFKIRLVEGRDFSDVEQKNASAVAIVSQTLARRLWPGQQGLGQRVRVIEQSPDGLVARPWRTVVGIVADVRQAYDDADLADLYTTKIPDGRYGTFYFRATASMPSLFAQLRAAAADLDPDAVISEPKTVADDDERLGGMRFLTSMLAGFAGVSVFLSILGIYGVTAYTVHQRRKEVAIRMALGASPPVIVRMFLRHAGLMLVTGTIAGLAGGVALSRMLRRLVFGVGPGDLSTYALASALLLTAGFIAVWRPARRAALMPPARWLSQ
jgi:predicted permease